MRIYYLLLQEHCNIGTVMSVIDHIFTSCNMNDFLEGYVSVDSVKNTSDHLAVICLLSILITYVQLIDNPQKRCMWSKCNQICIEQYQMHLDLLMLNVKMLVYPVLI